jgi:hypothetical protein
LDSFTAKFAKFFAISKLQDAKFTKIKMVYLVTLMEGNAMHDEQQE